MNALIARVFAQCPRCSEASSLDQLLYALERDPEELADVASAETGFGEPRGNTARPLGALLCEPIRLLTRRAERSELGVELAVDVDHFVELGRLGHVAECHGFTDALAGLGDRSPLRVTA